MPLCRLIYKSRTSWNTITNEILHKLAKTSRRSNADCDITGILILSDESFLQVLEGPQDAVNALYRKIINDKLHDEVTLLSYEQVASRTFAEWSMKVVDLNDLPMASRDHFRLKYKDDEGYIRIPDDTPRAMALLLDAKAMCAD